MKMDNPFFSAFREKTFKYTAKYSDRPKVFILKMSGWLLKNMFSVSGGETASPDGRIKIAVILGGGIGDMALCAPYIQRLSELADNAPIDIYSRDTEAVEGIFFGKKFVGGTLNAATSRPVPSEYDLILEMSRNPVLRHVSKRLQGRVGTPLSDYARRLANFSGTNPHFSQSGAIFDCVSVRHAEILGLKRATQADFDGSMRLSSVKYFIECALATGDVLGKFGLSGRKIITVQRGAKRGNADTKLWSAERFAALVEALKYAVPQFEIVQLGRASSQLIRGVDADLRGATNFEELKSILKASTLHIDCECGMVHLKHFLGGSSAVIFGPTCAEFYGYQENVNICANVCPPCEWVTSDWNKKCPRGEKNPPCMNAITVGFALEKILAKLRHATNAGKCFAEVGNKAVYAE